MDPLNFIILLCYKIATLYMVFEAKAQALKMMKSYSTMAQNDRIKI